MHIPCTVCSRRFFPAFRQSGSRPPSGISLIVLHDTEGDPKTKKLPTAAGVASYFQSHEAGGSAHLVVDSQTCFRSLDDTTIPWGAAGGNANVRGLHIEMVGWAFWTRAEWLNQVAMLDCAADKVAKWTLLYKIPPVSLSDTDLAANRHGITTHAQITRVFKVAGGHTDPGVGFPMDVFLAKVQERIGQIQSSGEELIA